MPLVLSAAPDVSIATSCATDSDRFTDELDDAVAAYLEGTALASVGFLGPITVYATGRVEPDRRARLTEIVAYLAVHRRGAAVADFDAAIWPDRPVTLKTRNQAITRARAWLGGDDDGVSWLRPMVDGKLRFSRQVLVDWELFQSLQERAWTTAVEPVAMTTWSVSRVRPSTSTLPGPAKRPLALKIVTPLSP